MGLLDWFSKDAKLERATERWGKKLMQKYMQTAERKRAIEALTDIGTPEAISALLRRFQYRTDATIVDEDEKQQVYAAVVGLGDDSVTPLVTYISNELSLYWPAKALRAIVGDAETARHIITALDGIEDSFGTNQQRREQLVDSLRGLAHEETVYQKLLALMQDEDEEVVIRAIDGLSARDDDAVAKAVIPMLLVDGTSARVRTMAMELMTEQNWQVPKEHKKALREILPSAYFIDDTGVVRRK